MSRFSGPGPHAEGWHDVSPSRRVKKQKAAEAYARNARTPDWDRRASREGPPETRRRKSA